MALTRKMLKAMGIEDEKIDQIVEAHTETVDGLKADIARYKADAEALPEVQKQLETAQAGLEAAKKDSFKDKYDALKKEFEEHKAEQAKKETRAAKETAFRALLKAAGVHEKRLEAVMKVSDIEALELDEKGAVKDAEKRTEDIKKEWADFIATTTERGANPATPPGGDGGSPAANTRAAQIAAQYHKNLYGEVKKE